MQRWWWCSGRPAGSDESGWVGLGWIPEIWVISNFASKWQFTFPFHYKLK